ncbi:MarR family winged helix-turn-helix transcriptional regulator [Cellulomonas fimi]|uniref:Winged helix-turn-helix transcriptional regulator n=1 Tax=Cellulomonas fimi TaxID=1708 RepID=A0A7Y0LXF8_CELFI|nr:MarR family winged helix-turn-helix transcriptional regulator [Cellulomonas fimi]NMR20052.1 winged helix-turn-helix transcriptional regulator [Cellulomonas fimi]
MSTVPEDRGPGERTEDFGWSLVVLLRAYQAGVTAALGDVPHGHRGYQVLSTVVHGDQPSQLALAAHLGIDRTVMTYLIDDLVAAGLVERRPNPQDRRQRKIVATADGTRTLADLERRVDDAQDRILSALAPRERETLCTLVRRVARDTRGADSPGDPCAVVDEALDPRLPSAGRPPPGRGRPARRP